MSTKGSKIAMAVLVAAAGLWMHAAQAQQDHPPMGPGQGMGGPGMHGTGMGGGPGMGHPGMMHIGPPPILEATDKYVYVLRGDTLFQYSADGLKLLARTELPRPEPRERPEGKYPPRK